LRQGAKAILLILLTGCRRGEILNLKWKDVKEDRIALSEAKTGPRDVWLSDIAKDLLRELRRRSQSPLVFPDPKDPCRPRKTLSCWATLRELADLPKDIRIHDLRHTYASHAVLAGESLPITGALVGHKSLKSTARYTHLDPGQVLKAAEDVQKKIAEWIC
jgi:integrase